MGKTAKERNVNWGSLDNFLAMGGYGFYVWGSYAMTALCIAIEVFLLKESTAKAEQ